MSIANVKFPKIASAYVIKHMQTVAETRRQRLAILVQRFGNSLAALNVALGLDRTDATLSQIRTQAPHSKTKKPRAMGDELARKIELALRLETGWMDTPPSYAEMHGQTDARAMAMAVMEAMPEDQWPKVLRMLDIFAQPEPKNGTQS